MAETNPKSNSKKPRRWLRWLLGLLVLVGVAVFCSWLYVKGEVAARVESQLSQLGLGKPEIGQVVVGANGVDAKTIKFFRPDSAEPWLSVGRLAIQHPFSKLVAGDEIYDGIEISDARIALDLDEPMAQTNFDLSTIKLPAKKVQLTNVLVELRQSNRTNLSIAGVSATLVEENQTINVKGSIDEFAGAAWTIAGDVTPSDKSFSLDMETEAAELVDGQWQRWPGMPDSIEKYVRGDASAKVDVNVSGNSESAFTPVAQIELNSAELNFPVFDLPVRIQTGSATFANGKVTFTDVNGTTNGIDQLTVSGGTTVTSFPVVTDFESRFRELDVATIRKLAPDIPTNVKGTADGTANGTVIVDQDLTTKLAVNAVASSGKAAYGLIAAASTTINVEINPLVLSSEFEVDELEGRVVVVGSAIDQTANAIFETLELDGLNQQLEIDATASGDFELKLPLATADNFATWEMTVSANAAGGSISQQLLNDVNVTAELAGGNLRFSEIKGTPVSGESIQLGNAAVGDSQLLVQLDWPISDQAEHVDSGIMEVSGHGVPAQWLTGFLERQISNASESGPAERTQNEVSGSMDRLGGSLNFNSKISLDANDPSIIKKWSGRGTISESTIIADQHRLEKSQSRFEIADGVLAFNELKGEFVAGGDLSADGKLSLETGELLAAIANTNEMPIRWIANVASEFSPDVAAAFDQIGIKPSSPAADLGGKLSARFELSRDTNDKDSWAIKTFAESNELQIKGQQLNNVTLRGAFDSNQIQIESAHAELTNRGLFDLTGNWDIAKNSGESDVTWQQLPLSWMARFGWETSNDFGGATSGKIRIAKRELPAGDQSIPVTVGGSVSINDLAIGGLTSKELGFEIRTEDNQLLFERFRANDDLDGIELVGTLELKSPFAFQSSGVVTALPLSRVFQNRSVIDQVGNSIEISGIANGNLKFNGQLEEFDWSTSGDLTVAQPRINGELQSNISAEWTHVGNDWKQSKANVKAFGGTIEMTEFIQLPQRIKVELNEIDAKELSAVTASPIQLTGKLSGNASFNEWDLAETRWADLNLRGASVKFGPAEFGDLDGNVEFRQQRLSYSLGGSLLNGKFTSQGETTVDSNDAANTKYPLSVEFTNGSLGRIYGSSPSLTKLRPLMGGLSAKADFEFATDEAPRGSGIVRATDLKWNNKLLTREISTNVNLVSGMVELVNLRADLKRGEISGRASIPVTAKNGGTYQLNFRQFDLEKFLQTVLDEPIDGFGIMDARITGQIGSTISGQGSIAINRAEIFGLSGKTLQVPIQFLVQPLKNSGRIEFRRSRFSMFNGNVSGSATLDFGRNVNFQTDLNVSGIDTELLVESLAGRKQSGQGDLSGHLKLQGTSIRSLRDLRGSFTGKLDRAEAFKLPVLDQVARFLGGNQIQANDFESDDIDIRLNRGQVTVKRLNFSNSLAKIAITGNAYVDGRLDLSVVGRIERLNQPTLIDQLAGSPLARFSGSPVALFAQAADFLSERLVFVRVGGTIRRPQVRPDTGKQVQEELIRYFLRGSQILPNVDDLQNSLIR